MKTRDYFTEKTNELAQELKADIIERTKEFIGDTFMNDDESNAIGFFNHISDSDDTGMIYSIYFGKEEITIYPGAEDLCEYHLSDIMDVHDLLLLHYIVSSDNFKNEI